ncbi:MAG: glycolate oxidase subunit GlcE [Kiloniellales bacterium]|nr:glycolate oxidase subunit GlcE [Kiloniellales bacterium]
MTESLRPENAEQVREAVAWAVSEEAPLEILGRGSKRGLGRPLQTQHTLDLSGLSGITLYEPEELILRARAGTPLAEIEAALAEKRQQLAFEPMDSGPLFGADPGGGSLGGLLACNLAGPRRIKAGGARDHFLGFEAVSGRGEAFKSGGRVVKNVTGYDLCKLLAGSYGTLAVMTEVTLKVLPAPEKARTVLVLGLEDADGVRALSRALGSAHEVSAAAHLPATVVPRSAVPHLRDAGGAVTLVRVEGTGLSVEHRCKALRDELADFGETEELHSQNSAAAWAEIRDVRALLDTDEAVIWRLSVAPTRGPEVAARLRAELAAEALYDWGGGLVWLAVEGAEDGGEALIRETLGSEGHATLIRGPENLRASVPVFQPQGPAKTALSERIKSGFDPRRVLNPGRMYAGI